MSNRSFRSSSEYFLLFCSNLFSFSDLLENSIAPFASLRPEPTFLSAFPAPVLSALDMTMSPLKLASDDVLVIPSEPFVIRPSPNLLVMSTPLTKMWRPPDLTALSISACRSLVTDPSSPRYLFFIASELTYPIMPPFASARVAENLWYLPSEPSEEYPPLMSPLRALTKS